MSVSVCRKSIREGIQALLGIGSSTRGSGQKLTHRKFHQKRKNFFTAWVTKHRNRLSRETVESPSLEILRNGLGTILCPVL